MHYPTRTLRVDQGAYLQVTSPRLQYNLVRQLLQHAKTQSVKRIDAATFWPLYEGLLILLRGLQSELYQSDRCLADLQEF